MNRDLLNLGWCMVKIALFLAFSAAVILMVAVGVRSVAGEEIGQPRYSQYSEATEWYDSFGRFRYGPQGNFTSDGIRPSVESPGSSGGSASDVPGAGAQRVASAPAGTWDSSGRWIDYSSRRQTGPWVAPAQRPYHWERVPIPMGIPPKDA